MFLMQNGCEATSCSVNAKFPQFHALGVAACEAHRVQSQQESPTKSEISHENGPNALFCEESSKPVQGEFHGLQYMGFQSCT